MYTAGIITASDKGSKGERVDESGEVIKEILEKAGYRIKRYVILPDEKEKLKEELKYMSDELKINLILTTGGTGFSLRDVTPEATKEVLHRETPGISEAIRQYSLSITKRAMLSRAVSGIRDKTLIINLPGSTKAVRESLEYVITEIEHGIKILNGDDGDCARNT